MAANPIHKRNPREQFKNRAHAPCAWDAFEMKELHGVIGNLSQNALLDDRSTNADAFL
jgi:hypothetical protein